MRPKRLASSFDSLGGMIRPFKLYVVAIMALPFCATGVAALTVPNGCATPTTHPQHHVFYVDPLNGSMSNDGSAAHPWKTLAEVLDGNQKLIASQTYSGNYTKGDINLYATNVLGPIKPGDVIYLKSGDHGDVLVSHAVNDEFITVQAAPGHTPILHSLVVSGAAKWMFAGLKVLGIPAVRQRIR